MTPLSASEEVEALWLDTLQRAVARASHDVKDALNGVSVNLEVIRSRAARTDLPATALAVFGDGASQQFDRLTTLLNSLLALTRAEREPADVGVTLRHVVVLCGASSHPSDAAIHWKEGDVLAGTTTRVPGMVVRLLLMVPLLDLAVASGRPERASEVTCTLSSDAGDVRFAIAAAGRQPHLSEGMADLARTAGVRASEEPRELTLIFPRP